MEPLLEKELIDLLEATKPRSLRRSVNEVFFAYLLNANDFFPEEFNTIVADFYFLTKFLDAVEDYDSKKIITEQQSPVRRRT